MTVLYQQSQIRELERLASSSGIDEYELMTRAGKAALQALLTRWPQAKKIVVYAGKGNNGGDGLVLARLAHEQHLAVTVYLLGKTSDSRSSAAKALKAAQTASVKIILLTEGLSAAAAEVAEAARAADVIVDALLGSGFAGEIRPPCDEIIAMINSAETPILAIDIPTGVQADTGEVTNIAVKADLTLSLIGLRQGLYTGRGPVYAGEIKCDALSLPESLFKQITPTAMCLSWGSVRPLLPRRDLDAHKGKYGHVLVVGGDYGMGGAVRMAAEAAARVGAGLVTVATRPEHIPIISGSRPELMCHQVDTPSDLTPLLARVSVVVVGPGLGKTPWAKALLTQILATDLPKVLDADALNLLSEAPQCSAEWILTPHPGEASRLLRCACDEVQRDRFKAVRELQKRYSGVAVLKGLGTLIKGEGEIIDVCPVGNPGMATGGMGDILSGVIGGLVAQKLSLIAAAQCGVFVHSLAADHAAQADGERGLLATDLLPYLRNLVNPH